MMELLRRFEEEAVQDEDIVDKEASEISNEGIGGEDSLVDRFAELDIGRPKHASATTSFYVF